LGDHADAAHAGVQAVGQREIDDAELAAEVDRRLGATVRQGVQARAATAREHQAKGASGELVGFVLVLVRVHAGPP
jgi:hypothetical protein